MEKVEVRSTSRHSAECSDIIVRDGEQVRLVFRPEIVDNPSDPNACIRGRFLYQRKGKRDDWPDFDTQPLSSLKKGDQFQLEIKAGELLPLLRHLGALYRMHRGEGVPQGRVEFLKIEQHLAKLLQLSEPELNDFLSANRADALKTLQRVLRWLSERPTTDNGELPELSALVGLTNLRAVFKIWLDNADKDDEEFWQSTLAKYSFVLSQLFAYPVVVIKDKAYVGGKLLDNKHGNLVDFLARIETSRTAVLVEIKTPRTALLDRREYRQDVFSISREIGGAISQVLEYRESLMQNIHTLTHGQNPISFAEPRCIIIAGSSSHELMSDSQKCSYERFRERLVGVTLVTFDEVFKRIEGLISLLEGSSNSKR